MHPGQLLPGDQCPGLLPGTALPQVNRADIASPQPAVGGLVLRGVAWDIGSCGSAVWSAVWNVRSCVVLRKIEREQDEEMLWLESA